MIQKIKHKIRRFSLWASRPLRCKFGKHEKDLWNVGRNMDTNIVDFYCTNCEKFLERKHREDFKGKEKEVMKIVWSTYLK